MSKKILFFGNERLATGVHSSVPTLQALIGSDYEVMAIVIAQAETGKSRQQRQLEVAAIAEQHNIPLLAPDNLLAARDQLAGYGAEAAVLIAYGKIVPQAIINVLPHGIINVHPSLLPLHRGSTPIESVILEGAQQTGVSLMGLSAKMDAGPVYAQKTVTLKGDETKQVLADKLSAIGVDLVLEYLPKILDGSVQPQAQDEAAATYDKLISKADSQIDWTLPAVQLERQVRAYAGWPRSRTQIDSTDVIITAAHVESGSGQAGTVLREQKRLGFYTGKDILIIDRLLPAGKKDMSAEAFLAGY